MALSEALGEPVPFGQSPFALGQGNRFEARVKADGYAELVRVLAEVGIELPTRLRSVSIKGGSNNDERVARTRDVLRAIAEGDPGAANVIDHGMTMLTVGGITVCLKQDALAARGRPRFGAGGRRAACRPPPSTAGPGGRRRPARRGRRCA